MLDKLNVAFLIRLSIDGWMDDHNFTPIDIISVLSG